MKPTKNQYYCPSCKHQKMQFESKKEAALFIKYNASDIEKETGKRPVRAYYCRSCCCWHVTSRPNSYDRKDLMKRFGAEMGSGIHNRISPFISKKITVAGGLLRKIKELRHNLKFQIINPEKCDMLIQELLSFFEVAIGAQLENKTTLDNLFHKFSSLCELYVEKTNKIATDKTSLCIGLHDI